MKRFLCFLLVIASLCCIPACQNNISYRDDLSIASLMESVRGGLNHQMQYSRADADYHNEYFTMPDFVKERDVYFSTEGNNLNEFGIFRVTEGNAEAMATHLKEYLSSSLEKNRDFYASYIPEEVEKLRDAEVKQFGNYVAYAILDRSSRNRFFSSLENGLRKKK